MAGSFFVFNYRGNIFLKKLAKHLFGVVDRRQIICEYKVREA
jgi:hypothetical protein